MCHNEYAYARELEAEWEAELIEAADEPDAAETDESTPMDPPVPTADD